MYASQTTHSMALTYWCHSIEERGLGRVRMILHPWKLCRSTLRTVIYALETLELEDIATHYSRRLM
jgi:hypothetical protein